MSSSNIPGEQAPPSEAVDAIALTEELAHDLQAAIAGRLPRKPTVAKADSDIPTPRFGSVYFGPLDPFANGEPHFGMVRGNSRRHQQVEVLFAPITTRKLSGRRKQQTVLLPPGTLPSRVTSGFKLMEPSRILLFMTIPIPLGKMRNLLQDRMHFVKTLEDAILEEVRAILARL